MSELKSTQQLLEMLQAGQPKAKTEVDSSTIRYALYARKSTAGEDSQTHSIDDQIEVCMERIIVPEHLNVKVYSEAVSAKESGTRDKFKQMVDDIKAGRINGLIAWHPDRLARNMKDSGEIIDLIDRGSIVDMRFATFTFENTAEGKMTLGITFVMSKQYSEHLSDSVNRGNGKAIERGEFIGKFKHGYIVDASRRFQPDERNFTKVKNIFQMVLDGGSQKEALDWINKQDYSVQKLPGSDPKSHKWTKDDVSELIRDPHYAGVHKWGKHLVDLTQMYSFEPMITVSEFLKINRINNLDSSKILSINRPKGGIIKANLLRGIVYCGSCNKTLTSMLLPKKDNGKLVHYRYYYKCETKGCPMFNKSAKAKLVIDEAQRFFATYLFTTKDNYKRHIADANKNLDKKNAELTSNIARLQRKIAEKEADYDDTKDFLKKNVELKEHYNLGKQLKEINGMKAEHSRLVKVRKHTKDTLRTYEEYLNF